ncbi:MAG: MGMT family protein [Bacteroidales bacterium]|nr:MGMT family protein [Bacteroidales bacterium]MBN2818540.1 MGMT family protein [Bacteroidales bacterium]
MKNDNFFERVYEVTKLVPHGRVTSYGAIAKCIGSPGASRMVGWALNNCHAHEQPIPAHRVVNRKGFLTGKHHFRHPDLMQELLESEGIRVENDCVADFMKLFWDPSSELV